MLNPSNSNNWYFDTDHMYNYCRGYTFPLEALQDHEASPEEIDLITGLMAPNPSDRISATAALESEWFTKIVDSDTGLPALLPWSTVVVDSGIGQKTLTPCSNQQTLYPDPNMTIRGVSRATGSASHSFENHASILMKTEHSEQANLEDPSQTKPEESDQNNADNSDQTKPENSNQAVPDDSTQAKTEEAGPLNGASVSYSWTGWFW